MKKFLMLTTAVLLSTSAFATEATESAKSNGYLSVMGGYNKTDVDLEIYGYKLISDSFDTTTLTIEAGHRFNDNFRLGFETAFRYTDLEGWELKYQMINPSVQAYVDFPIGNKITPYLNAGAGMSFGWTDDSEDDMQNSFTYNIGAGFNVKLNDRISFDAKYRYVNFGDLYDDYGLTVPATGNEFLAGIRLEF